MPGPGFDATGREPSPPTQGRIVPLGLRPRAGREALAADFAAGSGGAGVGPGLLEAVFCFGDDVEEVLRAAGAQKGADDERVKALGMLRAADALVQAGRLHEAAKEVESAQDICRELRFQEGRACAMTIVAKIYAKQVKLSTADQLDQAQDLASDAQEQFEKLGSKKCEAAALLALAAARHALKKYDLGNSAAKEAQLLLEALGDRSAVAEVYQVVADGYLLNDDTKRATKMVNRAKAIHVELGDKKKEAHCLRRVGQIEVKGNDQGKATAALSAAQEISRQLGDYKSEVAALETLRDLHVKKGRIAEGVDVGKAMVSVYHAAGDAKGEGNALVSLSEFLIEKDELKLAMNVVEAAHKLFTGVRDGEGMAKVYELFARLKNENFKRELRDTIDQNIDFANYPLPDRRVVEPGLGKQVIDAYNETTKKGL